MIFAVKICIAMSSQFLYSSMYLLADCGRPSLYSDMYPVRMNAALVSTMLKSPCLHRLKSSQTYRHPHPASSGLCVRG